MDSADGTLPSESGPYAKSLVDRLLPLIYDELRAVAAALMRRERAGHTLQPTALVHEAYLRLLDQRNLDFADRVRLLAAAAQAMRRVLVDHARRRARQKRGGGLVRLTLADDAASAPTLDTDVLALDEALEHLRALDAVDHEIVELRFFGGLRMDEIAGLLGLSERTVRRRYSFARAWLFRELHRRGRAAPRAPGP